MIGQALPVPLNASMPQAWLVLSMPEQDILSAHCQLWRWLFDAAGNWPGTSDSFQAGHQIAICHLALVEKEGKQVQSHMPQSGKALESYEWPPRWAAYVFGAIWAFCEVPPWSADEHLKGNCGWIRRNFQRRLPQFLPAKPLQQAHKWWDPLPTWQWATAFLAHASSVTGSQGWVVDVSHFFYSSRNGMKERKKICLQPHGQSFSIFISLWSVSQPKPKPRVWLW